MINVLVACLGNICHDDLCPGDIKPTLIKPKLAEFILIRNFKLGFFDMTFFLYPDLGQWT